MGSVPESPRARGLPGVAHECGPKEMTMDIKLTVGNVTITIDQAEHVRADRLAELVDSATRLATKELSEAPAAGPVVPITQAESSVHARALAYYRTAIARGDKPTSTQVARAIGANPEYVSVLLSRARRSGQVETTVLRGRPPRKQATSA